MNLVFKIEQVAIAPPNKDRALRFLAEIGIDPKSWTFDHVIAEGEVFGTSAENEADLHFNYDLLSQAKEFEVLDYTAGNSWMAAHGPSASHLGMHVSAEELDQWRAKFASLNISVAQEVNTLSHSNPVIAGKRSYNYVIFNTRHILGIDLKFIVRKNLTDEVIVTPNDNAPA
jgi:hypothetical protein